jgi:hypothetical protein
MTEKKQMKDERDPFLINPDDVRDIKSQMKSGSSGEFCPNRNKLLLGGKCFVCDSLKKLWNYPKESKEWKLAVSKSAKLNFFFCIVDPTRKDKWLILESGKNVGNELLDGIEKGWKDVFHPKAGKGRELIISKSVASGFNKYTLTPNLDKADWDIPQEVLDSYPNLDNIIDMIQKGELVEGVNYMRISSLKQGESFKFRLLPFRSDAKIFKLGVAWIYRHFGGVTKDEIDGTTPVDLSMAVVDDETQKDDAPFDADTKKKPTQSSGREKCFGMAKFYEPEDDMCKKCKDFSDCGKAVAGA